MLVGGCCTGGEVSLGGIFPCGTFNLFACNSTSKGAMVIWMPRMSSARQLGLDVALKGMLTVVGSAIAEVEEVWAEFGQSSLHTFPT